jgi:hypothetical protein
MAISSNAMVLATAAYCDTVDVWLAATPEERQAAGWSYPRGKIERGEAGLACDWLFEMPTFMG